MSVRNVGPFLASLPTRPAPFTSVIGGPTATDSSTRSITNGFDCGSLAGPSLSRGLSPELNGGECSRDRPSVTPACRYYYRLGLTGKFPLFLLLLLFPRN